MNTASSPRGVIRYRTSSPSSTRAQVTGPKIKDDFVAACKKVNPMNALLAKAMGLEW